MRNTNTSDFTEEYEMADDLERAWVWSPPVYLKDTPEAIHDLQQEFGEIVSNLKISKTETANRLFLLGMETYLTDPANIHLIRHKNRRISDKYREGVTRRLEIKRLRSIYNNLFVTKGIKSFVEWCQENEVIEDLYEEVVRELSPDQLSWREKAVSWLLNTCLADGNPKPTAIVKQEAMNAEIIVDAKKDWTKLRVVASSLGLVTEEHGVWQLRDI